MINDMEKQSKHKFDPAHAHRLNNPIRRILVSTKKALADIRPGATDAWADIGCGTGYFTIPLALITGRVFALDVSAEMLDHLKRTVKKKGIANIELRQSNEDRLPLADASVDGVLLAFVAHELDRPADFFRETARTLKKNGRLVIVDFAKVPSFGPPLNHRLDPDQVTDWALEAGFTKGASWVWSRAVVGWEYIKTG